MTTLILKSPLAGWAMPVEEIPDPVFAQGMAGDGMAIDPTGDVLHAPCTGEIASVAKTGHALTLRAAGGAEILLHLGIDTVTLSGEGFEPLVRAGERVECGQPLLRFDLDLLARRAASLCTPVLLVAGGRVIRCTTRELVAVGDTIMEIELEDASDSPADSGGPELCRDFVVRFEHGLHARPAAELAAALRPFASRVELIARGAVANAKSTVAVMALGVQFGETVAAKAVGADAGAALDAVASVLAMASHEAVSTPATADAPGAEEGDIRGVIASRGLALGPAAFLRKMPRETIDLRAGDAGQETARLHAAIGVVHARIERMLDSLHGPQREILQAHAELVLDPGLAEQAERHIAAGSSAGRGWSLAIADSARALERLLDARMQERIADLRDIEHQVLDALDGDLDRPTVELPENAILLADELLPSQLIGLDRGRLAGICTARGGPTSHVAIIAAALGIPALVAAGARVLEVAAGSTLLLDAEHGRMQVEPTPAEQERIAGVLSGRRARRTADLASAAGNAHTRDGSHVRINANLGAAEEAMAAVAHGADGCGLLRTEFLFLQRQSPPDEDEQFEVYRRIRDLLAPRPLTIRTMDIGGDKPIAYLPLPAEENPALGLRGLRTSLARPQLLRTQLRAILRLESPDSCRIMLPMVTDLGDLTTVRRLLRECADELGIQALPRLGAMVETPASALLADQLLREADFLSIGTNDLSQYVLAMDRGHPLLAARLDALHPAVLRLVGSVAAAGESRGREVAVCGGLGSDPDALALLVGLGIRELSAVPGAIPELKRIVRSLDIESCRSLARLALELPDATAVRRLVADWMAAATELETDR